MQLISLPIVAIMLVFLNCGQRRDEPPRLQPGSNQFRVAAYNIRYAADADEQTGNGWDKRKRPLADVIKKHGFDLIGTQEGMGQQLTDLKGMLPGFDYIGYPYGGKGDLHNCATFYRTELFEVSDSGVFWFSETPDIPSIGWDATDRRICQWVKFKIRETDKVFYFFNVHFYWRLEVAKRESGPVLVRKIKEIAGESPAISVGDFNSTAETSQISAIKEILFDAYDRSKTPRLGVEGTAFPGGVFQGIPQKRIDYIFISSHFEVEDYQVLSDQYDGDLYPSDHLPVTSLLTFK